MHVNQITGVHTNNAEQYWSRAKAEFKRMNETSKDIVPRYLDECCGNASDAPFIRHILCHIDRVCYIEHSL